MTGDSRFSTRFSRWRNRRHARRAARSRQKVELVEPPEPRTIGSYGRGRHLLSGKVMLAGYLVSAGPQNIWELRSPVQAFDDARHGFAWLDDLAAVGDTVARNVAQTWVLEWIVRFGKAKSGGWTPELTGRRVMRWINHADFLMRGLNDDQTEQFLKSLGQQSLFLHRRWHGTPDGIARLEALLGLIYAGLYLKGREDYVDPAAQALSEAAEVLVDEEGGITSRNPEELLEIFTLLTLAAEALEKSRHRPQDEHIAIIQRIAPILRALRHADGGLTRFHGGGRGLDGRLDHALARSGVKTLHKTGNVMGYQRLSAGRITLIADVAPPPMGQGCETGHASTLAFELTSGRRPVIVNCGDGRIFGQDWSRAGRATPSHSTLGIEGHSSARIAENANYLSSGPEKVPLEIIRADDNSVMIEGAHDGYAASHGLFHIRQLELSPDGRTISGSDALTAVNDLHKARFDAVLDNSLLQGVLFQIRFHLHPDVHATLDMGGNAVSLTLKSTEVWVFRHDGRASMTLEPSVYLEKGRLHPRATKQVVLTARAMTYATRVTWTLAKAKDTPNAVRDLEEGDLFVLE
ncbi:heparinase II/III family protein [Pseudaestuariivita rosea]|uniref:heparinase II/III family protein n=1 Tax=Pseudaestuariivita rosea TaxID=2763263 RepID=UPI001ABB0278|nr:heparinase II/III family protein [Pseudaestuariivita rosea]